MRNEFQCCDVIMLQKRGTYMCVLTIEVERGIVQRILVIMEQARKVFQRDGFSVIQVGTLEHGVHCLVDLMFFDVLTGQLQQRPVIVKQSVINILRPGQNGRSFAFQLKFSSTKMCEFRLEI